MLDIHFTLPMVIDYLRVIVSRDPERVASAANGGSGCIYLERSGHVVTPVCIVGQMFADLGLLRLLTLDPSNLTAYGDQHGACSVDGDFWNGLEKYGITADTDAQRFLRSVQYKQDSGNDWGDALDMTKQEWLDEQTAVLDDEQAVIDGKRQELINMFS